MTAPDGIDADDESLAQARQQPTVNVNANANDEDPIGAIRSEVGDDDLSNGEAARIGVNDGDGEWDNPYPNFLLSHWKELLALAPFIPILVCAIRVYVVSGGDSLNFRTFVKTLDIPALLLTTFLPVVPLILCFMGGGLFTIVIGQIRELRRTKRAVGNWGALGVASLVIAAIGALTMPLWALLNVVALAAFLCILLGSAWWVGGYKLLHKTIIGTIPYMLVLFMGFVLLAASGLAPAWQTFWLPAEVAEIEGDSGPHIIYVLEIGEDGRTTIYDRTAGTVRIVSLEHIKNEQPCTAPDELTNGSDGWLGRSLWHYIGPESVVSLADNNNSCVAD
jgi:hypothetical protein